MPWAYKDGPTLAPQQIAEALGSFYFDLTASTSAASLDAIRRLVPADRLLMGFDFPMMPTKTVAGSVASVSTYPGFTPRDHQKIVWENAMCLFHL